MREERLEEDALAPLRSRLGLRAGHAGAGGCQAWQKAGPSGGTAGRRRASLGERAFRVPCLPLPGLERPVTLIGSSV